MRITIIGKYGPYPGLDGGTSCYLVESGKIKLVLDFGSGILSGLARHDAIAKLDAVVLSHLHYDHISDLFPYIYYLEGNQKRAMLYLPRQTSLQFKSLAEAGVFDLRCIEDGTIVHLKGLTLTFYKMIHPGDSYSVKISDGKKTFFYSGDTCMDNALLSLCTDVDLALLDCGGFGAHLSLLDAAYLADKTGIKIIATHLHPEKEYLSNHPNIRIANIGDTYEL